jgi:hypothetical protein
VSSSKDAGVHSRNDAHGKLCVCITCEVQYIYMQSQYVQHLPPEVLFATGVGCVRETAGCRSNEAEGNGCVSSSKEGSSNWPSRGAGRMRGVSSR